MKVIAPGKLVLTGAYAVLEGAPAIVAAVDRYAVATAPSDGTRDTLPADSDVRALQDGAGRKLGLGSSAASLVASLGARAWAGGADLRSGAVRSRIFTAAREAHARLYGGGSGVDVAASVHGGMLRYAIDSSGAAIVRELELPQGVHLAAYDSGASARTSDMLSRFDRLRSREGASRLLTALGDLATKASLAVETGDGPAFVAVACEFGKGLAELGRSLDMPIVPPRFGELALLAERDHAAFLPSGAGGGDVAVRLGLTPPSAAFATRAEALSMQVLSLRIDRGGLRAQSQS